MYLTFIDFSNHRVRCESERNAQKSFLDQDNVSKLY